jgi:hypothetical protein
VVGRVRRLECLGGGGRLNTQTGHLLYSVRTPTCVMLHFVITNISISAFSATVLTFKHSYAISGNNTLNAQCGLFQWRTEGEFLGLNHPTEIHKF